MRLVLRARRRIDWALYTHETRMLVVGSGGGGGGDEESGGGGGGGSAPALSSWQFAAGGVVHLPLFELRAPLPAAAAAARAFITGGAAGLGAGAEEEDDGDEEDDDGDVGVEDAGAGMLPPRPQPPASAAPWAASEAGPVGAAAAAGGCGASARCGGGARAWLLRMYGRVYLARATPADAPARLPAARPASVSPSSSPALLRQQQQQQPPSPLVLELHRFYSDALLPERAYALPAAARAGDVELSVVDNALVVHHPALGVAAVFDAGARSRLPIASPLPLRRLAPLPSAGAGGDGGSGGFESVAAAHGPGWRYLAPNLILDADGRRLFRLHLDLSAVAASAPGWPALAGFLQRRRAPPPAAAAALAAAAGRAAAAQDGGGAGGEPKALLLAVCRAALQEPPAPRALRALFAQLARGAAAAAGGRAGADALPPAPSALSPAEVARELFGWARGEAGVDALHLQAALSEYAAALEAAALAPPPELTSLAAELLLQRGAARGALSLLRAGPAALALPLAERLEREEEEATRGGGALHAQAAVCSHIVTDVYARLAAAEARAAARGAAAAGGAAAGGGGIAAAAAAIAGAPAPATLSPAPSPSPSRRVGALPRCEAHIKRLAASGQALRAARLARDRGAATALDARALLEAAAARGDARLFAALHRALGRGPVADAATSGEEGAEAAMARLMAAAAAGGSGGGAAATVE